MDEELSRLFAAADAAIEAANTAADAAMTGDERLPAERTAGAVESLAKGFESYARVANSLYGQMRVITAREERLENQLDKLESLESRYDNAFVRALSNYDGRLKPVAAKVKEEMAGASKDAKETLAGAVEEACGKVKNAALKSTATLGACAAGMSAVMIVCVIVGGLWALLGGAAIVRFSPAVQEFATTPGGIVTGIAILAIVFAAGIVVDRKWG